MATPALAFDLNVLVEDNAPMVRAIAGQQAAKMPRHIAVDDLYQEGLIGLLDAARKYDPALGVSFPAYARRRVLGAILDYIRDQGPLSRDHHKALRNSGNAGPKFVSLSVLRKNAKAPEEAAHEVLAARDHSVAACERRLLVRELVARVWPRLTTRERQTLRFAILGDMGINATARKLGLCVSRLVMLQRHVFEKLREVAA